MSYQVLARKYRPQRFADVVGQEHVTRTLLNALAQGRTAHGYIFSGHRGIGKTTVARILAMALNCRAAIGSEERPTPEPCGKCLACTEVRAGNAVDVIEIDAATNRGIDEVRELREAARYSPARDSHKIYILDEAHQITDAAFNALLKTLEEPPDHVVFMMATTQPEDIPQTIRSRCQHFSFHAVRFGDILQQLRQVAAEEKIVAEDAALALLAESGDGSIRDALSVMDQAIASAAVEDGHPVLVAEQVRALMGSLSNAVFEQMMQAVKEQNAASMLEQAASLLDAGNAPQQIARQFVRFLRNCLMAKIAGPASDLLQVSEEERARAARTAEAFSQEDLLRFLNSMLRTFDDLNYRQEHRFHLELGLLKLVYAQRLLPLESILQGLSSGSVPSTPAQHAGAAPMAHTRTQEASAVRPQAAVFTTPFAQSHPGPANGTTMAEKGPSPFPALGLSSQETTPDRQRQQLDGTIHARNTAEDHATQKQRPDVEHLRTAICNALASAGHTTLASLLADGAWQWEGGTLLAGTSASKTMLEMAYTTEAQRVAREELNKLAGKGCKLEVRSASNGRPSGQNKQPVANTPALAMAQDHPLLLYAKELFHAEVRSTVDLRPRN